MTELKQLRDFAEEINGIRPTERSLKGVVNNLIGNYKPTKIVANPYFTGEEIVLNRLGIDDTNYSLLNENNYVHFDIIPMNAASTGKLKYLTMGVTINYHKLYDDNTSNIESVDIIIEDKTANTITIQSIDTLYSSYKVSGKTIYKEKKGTRYGVYMLNVSTTTPSLSEHKLFCYGRVKYKGEIEGSSWLKCVGTNPILYDIPNIE